MPLTHNGGYFQQQQDLPAMKHLALEWKKWEEDIFMEEIMIKLVMRPLSCEFFRWGLRRTLSDQQGYYPWRNTKCLPPLSKGLIGKISVQRLVWVGC